MISEAQIRHQLLGYLSRQVSLNEFEDWLVQHSWDVQDSEEGAQTLVGALELRFAEYANGHLTDDGLERELKGLVQQVFQVGLTFGLRQELRR